MLFGVFADHSVGQDGDEPLWLLRFSSLPRLRMISVSGFSTNYSSFVIFIFLLTMFSCYLFPTPPGGMAEKKTPSHFTAGDRTLVDRAGFEPAAFRLVGNGPCEPNVLRPDKRQYTRLNYRPQKRPSRQTHLKTLASNRP